MVLPPSAVAGGSTEDPGALPSVPAGESDNRLLLDANDCSIDAPGTVIEEDRVGPGVGGMVATIECQMERFVRLRARTWEHIRNQISKGIHARRDWISTGARTLRSLAPRRISFDRRAIHIC
jgi:hypothetical protein